MNALLVTWNILFSLLGLSRNLIRPRWISTTNLALRSSSEDIGLPPTEEFDCLERKIVIKFDLCTLSLLVNCSNVSP
ncbi:hypothetical protein HZH68_011823 [Vespula germanica]|uniref:Secreted protein n=1 Tax=Vespula germanica TaxID=30212 RepID=A0A834JM03_VESGE|nr:hypothetical protein HZH68_011823 [Vespula germanica]